MSDSVRPQRWQPTRLPRPWDSPGKNTGVGCHFLLQCMKVKNESEVAQSSPTLSDPMDCSLSGSSVHGIFQAKVLEWGATAFCYTPLLLVPWFSHILYFKYLLPKSANDFVRREKRLSFMIYWNYPQLVESTTLAPFLTSFFSNLTRKYALHPLWSCCLCDESRPSHPL